MTSGGYTMGQARSLQTFKTPKTLEEKLDYIKQMVELASVGPDAIDIAYNEIAELFKAEGHAMTIDEKAQEAAARALDPGAFAVADGTNTVFQQGTSERSVAAARATAALVLRAYEAALKARARASGEE